MSRKNFLSSLYKNEAIYSEERSKIEGIKRVPLTSMPYLNYAIGGGIPVGYLIQHAGATQAGKSFVSFVEAKHWQEHFVDDSFVLIADFEHTTTIQRCKQFGLDTSKDKLLIWKQPDNSGADFFDFLLDDFLPGCIENGIKPFIILDSKDCMIPPGEEGRKAAELEMGAMAKFLKRVLKRTVALLAEADGTMVIINQLVLKIGQLWGNPETTSGGNALKHNSVLDIWFKKVEKKEEQIFNSNDQKIGHKVSFKIDKNKVGSPHKTGFVKIHYDGKVVDRMLCARYGLTIYFCLIFSYFIMHFFLFCF